MWGDFFRFSSTQRMTMLVLFVLLLLLIVIDFFYFRTDVRTSDLVLVDENYSKQTDLLSQSIHKDKVNRNRLKYDSKSYVGNQDRKEPVKIERFLFDPNKLDSASFIRLGLLPWQAHNVMRYRQKGGRFRKAEDFSRIYGLSSTLFASLRPYIVIPSNSLTKDETEKIENQKKEVSTRIELNKLDTLSLQKIMKPVVARQIVYYGETLGGYVSSEQLYEAIPWANKHYVEYLRSRMIVDSSQVRRINVNRASVEQMCRHPYISYRQAQSIFEYRRNHGHVSSLDDLRKLPDLTTEFWQRTAVYLTVQ